jgi:2-dehydropantoate 2-reductase
MKIIILGAGAIGCLVGGYLWRAGNEVVLVGRPGQIEIINKDGLKFITPSHDYVLNIPAVTVINEININQGDVIFLCVKGQDTEEALVKLKSGVEDIPVICMQNGVRNEEIAVRYFSKVYGAMLRIGAEYLKDGEIIARNYPPGLIILGCYPQGTDNLVVKVSEQLRAAGFWVKFSDTVMAYKWGKLRSNLDNVVQAITNTTGAEVELIGNATKQELDELLKEAGIHSIFHADVAREWPEIIAPEQFNPDRRIRNSTWQSLMRKQGSVETEFLNGEVVRLAQKLGHQAPLNEKLTQIAKEIAVRHEPPGKYTPEKLLSILGLGG